MIREIIKKFLGENLTKQNKKYVKVNAVTIVLMFIVSFAMLFFLPKEIPIIHEGDIHYPIPTILGIWLVPLLACVMNFTFIRQKRMNIINSISLIAMLMLSTYYYFTLI